MQTQDTSTNEVQNPSNAYDTSQDKARASALQNELAQAEASLENDFIDFALANLNEKDEELFFEDKKAFLKHILELQNAHYKEKIGSKKEELFALENSIKEKENLQGISQAQDEFLQKHPEADIEALSEFYTEDLGNKYKNELDKLAPNEFFEVLYQIYQNANGIKPNEKEKENLPKQLEANGSDVEKSSLSNEDLPMTRI